MGGEVNRMQTYMNLKQQQRENDHTIKRRQFLQLKSRQAAVTKQDMGPIHHIFCQTVEN